MSHSEIDFKKLSAPFPPEDVEWRVQRAGVGGRGPWASVIPYVTNRAIMNRLDEVCGPENWANQFLTGPEGGILCGISIKTNGSWLTKWDGAENTKVEPVKGGLSDAMKRAAVQWGIGRYLYKLEAAYVSADEHGKCLAKAKKDGKEIRFKWNPPQLPAWAIPKPPMPPVPSTINTIIHDAWLPFELRGKDLTAEDMAQDDKMHWTSRNKRIYKSARQLLHIWEGHEELSKVAKAALKKYPSQKKNGQIEIPEGWTAPNLNFPSWRTLQVNLTGYEKATWEQLMKSESGREFIKKLCEHNDPKVADFAVAVMCELNKQKVAAG